MIQTTANDGVYADIAKTVTLRFDSPSKKIQKACLAFFTSQTIVLQSTAHTHLTWNARFLKRTS